MRHDRKHCCRRGIGKEQKNVALLCHSQHCNIREFIGGGSDLSRTSLDVRRGYLALVFRSVQKTPTIHGNCAIDRGDDLKSFSGFV